MPPAQPPRRRRTRSPHSRHQAASPASRNITQRLLGNNPTSTTFRGLLRPLRDFRPPFHARLARPVPDPLVSRQSNQPHLPRISPRKPLACVSTKFQPVFGGVPLKFVLRILRHGFVNCPVRRLAAGRNGRSPTPAMLKFNARPFSVQCRQNISRKFLTPPLSNPPTSTPESDHS